MVEIPAQYFYLCLTVPFVAVWLFFYFWSKNTRREQVSMSLIGAVAGPLSEIVYFRDYWAPQSIFPIHIGTFPLMVEDIVFGFAIVGIAAIVYEAVMRTRLHKLRRPRSTYTSSLVLLVFAGTLCACMALGLNSIYASAAAFVIAGIPMVWLRHDLFINALESGLGVMFVMFISYYLLFSVASNIEDLMKLGWLIYDTSLDWRVANIPVTEMVWGFTAGFLTRPLYEFLKSQRAV